MVLGNYIGTVAIYRLFHIRLISGKDIVVENDGATFTVRVPLIYEEDLRDESMDY